MTVVSLRSATGVRGQRCWALSVLCTARSPRSLNRRILPDPVRGISSISISSVGTLKGRQPLSGLSQHRVCVELPGVPRDDEGDRDLPKAEVRDAR